tara:strand:- start:1433 stop:1810 length:378 start_codon:yes stop_codon:yes gene_type:complete
MPFAPPPKAKHQQRPPFLDAVGYWVNREHFPGVKSFGIYDCQAKNCSKRWTSAHAHKEFRQGCQKCEHFSLPWRMWYNSAAFANKSRTPPNRDDEAAAHDRLRCAACAAGVCTVDVSDAFLALTL